VNIFELENILKFCEHSKIATWNTFFNRREMELARFEGVGLLPWITTRPVVGYGGVAGSLAGDYPCL
jgi:hypothetical protein